MKTISLDEAQKHLYKYLQESGQGDTFLIAEDGIPRAELKIIQQGTVTDQPDTFDQYHSSESPRPPRKPGGSWKGNVWMADDFDTLPEEIVEAFGMQ